MSNLRPKPIWQVEKSNPDLAKKLDEAFRTVIDPEIGLNVMELGLIREVKVNQETAHVVMIMTTPFCPYAPALLESARSNAEGVVNLPTTIEMGMELWDPTYMAEGVGADWGLF